MAEEDAKRRALDERLSSYLRRADKDVEAGHTIANLRVELNSVNRRVRTAEAHVQSLLSEHNELRAEHDEHVQDSHAFRSDVLERVDGVENITKAHTDVLIRVKRRLRTGDQDDEMATGNFDLKRIQDEVMESVRLAKQSNNSERVRALETEAAVRKSEAAERKESETWLRRHAITVVSTIAATLIAAFLTTIIVLAIAGARQSTSVLPIPR